ncbi:ribose-5-phosphate isomerase RpiA [Granulicella arctica]|uniref:ribose-5-phosphate isomerase RpiA n=1 Tax=Granulicella arctica TaxID=940613 RepID=UPI0021DF61D5|nr:ribose-5-phosphate isomerase RpiA [Granulicella arctica]
MAHEIAKLLAARRALSFIEDGMAVGLGTGSTATLFIRELGERVRTGLHVRCIASSKASEELATSLGITLTNFEECPYLDVAVDGADEVAPGLALIKGGGGALLREKIVASAAKKFIVVADKSKVVDHLGGFPVPVEVIQMACPLVMRSLSDLGFEVLPRRTSAGGYYITDEGNFILDCKNGPIADPRMLADKIRAMVGVVEHGLFLGMATVALIADEDQLVERTS